MTDHFGHYLIKEAGGMDALRAGASAAKGGATADPEAVRKAVDAAQKGKASSTQKALLIAMGIGIGAGGVLLYQQHKRRK